jgi:hypothetical protein
MRITIATKGRYEPKCLDSSDQADADRPFVEYRLLTGEQIEAILAGVYGKSSWARIWREQVDVLGNVAFEIDGKDAAPKVAEVPGIAGTYPLYYEVASHILDESSISYEGKKK